MSSLIDNYASWPGNGIFTFLNNVDTDVASSDELFSQDYNGDAVIFIRGNLGGGTVAFQIASLDDPSEIKRFETMDNGVFTTPVSKKIIFIPRRCIVKVSFTGSSGAADVWVALLMKNA